MERKKASTLKNKIVFLRQHDLLDGDIGDRGCIKMLFILI